MGTRLVFVDSSSVPAFFNPVNDQVLPIPDFQGPPQAVLWDAADPNCFVISNGGVHACVSQSPIKLDPWLERLFATL